jgi:transcriptional regulator
MTDTFKNSKLFAMRRDEQLAMYEYYARVNGLQGKAMLILMWIYYNPEGITQTVICKKTYSTKQVVSAAIKSFIKKGYIFFEDDSRDKRIKRIKLTPEGHKFSSALLDSLESAEADAMKQLTPEQQSQFIDWLSILNKRLKQNIEKLTFKGERSKP